MKQTHLKESKHFLPALLLAFTMAFMAGCETMGLDNVFASDSEAEAEGEIGDDLITTLVNDAFNNDPELATSDIDVETINGEVFLSGSVNSRREYLEAEDLAMDIEGVSDVQNDLQIN
ncbi:MAG: BON domain-containing protein [Natronospirillum sp.]